MTVYTLTASLHLRNNNVKWSIFPTNAQVLKDSKSGKPKCVMDKGRNFILYQFTYKIDLDGIKCRESSNIKINNPIKY
jgi:hypothetical protein